MRISYKINVFALAVLLGGAGGLAVGVHFLHAYQERSNALALLTQADQAEAEGDSEQVIDYLAQYLGLVPRDSEVLGRLALLLDGRAKSPRDRLRAYQLIERALNEDDTRTDLRRHAVRMALRIGEYGDAQQHLNRLPADPNDAQRAHWEAQVCRGEGQHARAKKAYARAVRLAPAQADLSIEYALLLRRQLKEPREADAVVAALLKAGARSAEVRLEAARYYHHFGQRDRAEESIRFALDQLAAQRIDAFLLAAEVAASRGQADQARARLRRGLEVHPGEKSLSQALARLELLAGRKEEALRLIRPSLTRLPEGEEELWALGSLLLDLNQSREADQVIRHLRKGRGSWAADVLQARVFMGQSAWGQARLLLEKPRPLRTPPAVGRQAELLLAACHERLGNPDQQLRAARRALEGDPRLAPARRLAASALTALGKPDEAIREFRTNPDRGPDGDLTLARLLIARNAALPAVEQSWDEIDRLLKGASTEEARLVQAEALAVRGKVDEARALMEAACRRDPKQVKAWLFLAELARRPGQPRGVLAVLDEAERRAGPRVEWYLTRAGHWAATPSEESRRELTKLEAQLERFDGADRERLLAGLGQAQQACGDASAAARLWRDLARRRPDDLAVRSHLVELDYQAGRTAELEATLTETRRIEGPGGAVTALGEAARQLLRARAGQTDALPEARRHLMQARELRPSWAAVALLEAEAAELAGEPDRALERYQAALERGESRLGVVRKILQLLTAQQRFAEAQALMHRVPAQARSLGGFDRMAAHLDLMIPGGGEASTAGRKRALEAARKAVAADSKNDREYLWLGQMALLAEEPAEAVKAFRKARDLNDAAPDAWGALLLLLARTAPKEAESELAAAEKRLAGKLPLVLAAGYEALGKIEPARRHFTAALEARPTDPTVLLAVAGFHGRAGARNEAERLLRRLLEPGLKAPEATVAAARRALALQLAVGGNYARFKEALALVPERPGEAVEDRQTRALVLATRPAHTREAIKLFETLVARRAGASAEVRFALARLHEADGNWPLARVQLDALLAEHDRNPFYLAYAARALLRHHEARAAADHVERLARVSDRPFEVAELRARVLHARGQTDEAVRLVLEAAKEKGARLDQAAAVLDQLGRPGEAEKLFRTLAADAKDARPRLLLAQHLARQGNLPEALRLCEASWRDAPPEAVAQLSLAIVRAPNATEEQRRTVAGWLETAIARQPRSPGLLAVFATLQELRGQYDEAIGLYRKVLALAPRHALALNNLAYLLTLRRGEAAEALELIEKAIDEQGPNAELLDTRAVVHLAGGRADLARADLERAVALEPSSLKYFHLAQAFERTREPARARQALTRARLERGVEPLHPLERPAAQRLTATLAKR